MNDIRKGNCPLCDHHEIIEAIPAEFGTEDWERPAAVTYDPRWIASGRNPNHPHGHLRMYVCRSCGFTQQFAIGAAQIPIDDSHKTRLIVGIERDQPYR